MVFFHDYSISYSHLAGTTAVKTTREQGLLIWFISQRLPHWNRFRFDFLHDIIQYQGKVIVVVVVVMMVTDVDGCDNYNSSDRWWWL